MNNPNNTALLDMFQHPVFLVKDGVIKDANHAAQMREIEAGTSVTDLLPIGAEEYAAFLGGCLSLTVRVDNAEYIATVFRTADGDIFHLQSMGESPELQTMALAAQQLRSPLSEIMTAAETLFGKENIQDQQQVGLINRGLFRMMREIGNMSAIASYRKGRAYGKETKNIVAIINEIMDKAQTLCNNSANRLHYTPFSEAIYCPVDEEMLERAIYNLISNALKFSPADSTVIARLCAGKNKLLFTVESQATDLTLTQGNLFMRYIREAGVEDGRHGLGLGIPLIQCAAAAHNGTLLMDHPNGNTVRFTFTLSATSEGVPVLKTPFPSFDYLGGLDHGLVELSDVLPTSAFENE